MHVFYVGVDRHIHELFWDSGSWTHNDLTTQWGGVLAASGSNLAGTTFAPPGGGNSMHVFYLGADQDIHELVWSNFAWFANDLTAQWGGTNATSGSALISYNFVPPGSSNGMHIFYIGIDQDIEELVWSNNAWFANDLTAQWGGPAAVPGSALTGLHVYSPRGQQWHACLFPFFR